LDVRIWSAAVLGLVFTLSVAGAPLIAGAQQGKKSPRIGFLSPGSALSTPHQTFRQGLRELGYVEGQNIVVEYRWGDGDVNRLTALAEDLVRRGVDVLVTASNPATLAAREATSSTPIVFASSSDPVGTGFVASLAHPGGNVTGLSLVTPELSGKRLQLLQETLPKLTRVALLWDAGNIGMADRVRETEEAARKLGVDLHVEWVRDLTGLDRAFAALAKLRLDAFLTTVEPFTGDHQQRIVAFAAQQRLPAMYEEREFVNAGGLMAYGPSLAANYRRAAVYVDKIVKGAKPADLPVEQPARFDLVINLKTAKALGLTIPQSVLIRADELIR
jgi:putative ABC transport system substrate-binding protein